MARIPDADFHRISDELEFFKDQVRNLLNFGKQQYQVIEATTAPVFAGHAGEGVFIRNGTDGRHYVYMGSSWNLVYSWTADASALS